MKYAKWTFATILLAVFFSGCREPREKLYPITGKVTCQGEPVSSGIIRFRCPAINIDMQAILDANGEYEIVRGLGPGLPEGTYQVAISPYRPDRAIGDMGPPRPVQAANIPKKYHDPSTSGLTCTIKTERNRFDIDMIP